MQYGPRPPAALGFHMKNNQTIKDWVINSSPRCGPRCQNIASNPYSDFLLQLKCAGTHVGNGNEMTKKGHQLPPLDAGHHSTA